MTKSYKNTSILFNILGYIVAVGGTITVTQWTSILPSGYDWLATILVAVFGFALTQLTENKRVSTAEELVTEDANDESSTESETEGI